MLFGFILLWCFFTSIVGTTNPHRLAPEIISRDPFKPSNNQNDASKNIFSGVTRPRPIETDVVLQSQEPKLCQNSEILVKILNILQKMVTHDSSKGDVVSDVLNSVKKNLKSDPANIKSAEILNNLNDLEKLIEGDDGTPKPVLRQYTYRSAPGKLKTKIVFKYELPSISHPNCKKAFEKLIQTAHDAYVKLSNDPMCEDNGHNGNNQPNQNEINNPEQHPFNYGELHKNVPMDNYFNNDGSTLPLNSVPQDLLYHIKSDKLNPNNMLDVFKSYNLDHNHVPVDLYHQNPNGLNFLPDSAYFHGSFTNDNINQNNPRFRHSNITQNNNNKYTDFPPKGIETSKLGPDFFNQIYETNGKLNSKFPFIDDLKSKVPINDNKVFDSILNTKYPENLNSLVGEENKSNYQSTYDVITNILNKYNLAHKHPVYENNNGATNDKSNDGSDVKDDELLYKQNNIYDPLPNDSDYNKLNQKPNYQKYIKKINNLISQNPQQVDQKPDVENGIYDQDLTLNTQYFPNKQNNHVHSLGSIPIEQYNNNNEVPYINGKNPYQLNVNNFNPNHLPNQNTITVNKNGVYEINPNLNNIENAGTYYNLANINGANKQQNIAVPHSHYHPDLMHYGNHQPAEENMLPNLQHLLSITNLYKLNDLPHKADIIELTYMLKRSEPLVYQPFYIVKYRLPYTKFLYNVRDLISRKPYLRTNHEKLYQELIALSNVTETSDDLKGYPKEDIVKLTFNNGALVTAKIINANDTNINEQLKVIQNLNSNLNPEDILKLNKDNANKYYTRSGNNTSEPIDSKVSNNSVAYRKNYGNGLQYQRGNNVWDPIQNNQRLVLPYQNTNLINPTLPQLGNNIWNPLLANNKPVEPVLPNPNRNVINPNIMKLMYPRIRYGK